MEGKISSKEVFKLHHSDYYLYQYIQVENEFYVFITKFDKKTSEFIAETIRKNPNKTMESIIPEKIYTTKLTELKERNINGEITFSDYKQEILNLSRQSQDFHNIILDQDLAYAAMCIENNDIPFRSKNAMLKWVELMIDNCYEETTNEAIDVDKEEAILGCKEKIKDQLSLYLREDIKPHSGMSTAEIANIKAVLKEIDKDESSKGSPYTLKQLLLIVDILKEFNHFNFMVHEDMTKQAILLNSIFNRPNRGKIRDNNVYKFLQRKDFCTLYNYKAILPLFEEIENIQIVQHIENKIKELK